MLWLCLGSFKTGSALSYHRVNPEWLQWIYSCANWEQGLISCLPLWLQTHYGSNSCRRLTMMLRTWSSRCQRSEGLFQGQLVQSVGPIWPRTYQYIAHAAALAANKKPKKTEWPLLFLVWRAFNSQSHRSQDLGDHPVYTPPLPAAPSLPVPLLKAGLFLIIHLNMLSLISKVHLVLVRAAAGGICRAILDLR